MGNEEGDSSGDELVEVDALEESDDDFAYEEIDIDDDRWWKTGKPSERLVISDG